VLNETRPRSRGHYIGQLETEANILASTCIIISHITLLLPCGIN